MKMTAGRAGTAAGSRRKGSVRRHGVMAVLAAAAVACAGLVSGAGAAWGVPAGNGQGAAAVQVHWGRAEPVPGLAALNKGHNDCNIGQCVSASVTAVSCCGAGGCVMGGFYTDRHEHAQAFVARERRGRWGRAEEVPGTAALNKGGNAQVGSVSCARTCVCVAVGTYTDKAGNQQWFTVTTKDSRWGTAARVPEPALTDVRCLAAYRASSTARSRTANR